MAPVISTNLTKLLKIQHPVMCAGMGGITHHDLVAAVSNAGGIGTVGAIGLDPEGLREEIRMCKERLKPGTPFGVDLLLPKVGKGARKTNKDYTGGKLEQFVNIMIEEKVPLFVCAVGVPPQWVCEKLHANGIVIMNMVGSPKHVPGALKAGCDIICAQGTEAGGHTGDISTLVLVPQCVDLCKGHQNYFGTEVAVVAAGGICDGRGLAAALSLGAQGVWCGTCFLATPEANCEDRYKEQLLLKESHQTVRTLIYSGRPMRVARNAVINKWEGERRAEMEELLKSGTIPLAVEMAERGEIKVPFSGTLNRVTNRNDLNHLYDPDLMNLMMGQICGAITKIRPAATIVQDMVTTAHEAINRNSSFIQSRL
mmetsp:Transcript_25240/g.30553  ORF Transcript_25240/g.30553 Transcript_25240/m.30553 type:complete len:369 (+) Transcript_25240:64-1170(+)|eukprot:CAMPEP_0197843838 /NCGR_PEP_ID=MMETSP1438-20131217/790_1 /TAXON_ID=1461541 /ORGANISM="Pterosperma sp., Strain CCMP1384" /LENGTH=368 /DNA_ID=CAMNT_0043454247 /DNA_START=64 /DNA_END=1170 /DNA_ORIENTATION=-